MATPTEEVDALKASLESASATAKMAAADAGTYNSQVSALDKQLSSFAIPSGKVGVSMTPQELLAFQLQSIDNNAVGRTPAQTAELKAIVEQRAKIAIVAQEKNAIANQAYKAADDIDIQLEQKQTALASSNTSTIAPAPASAAPGDPTAYTPPPTTTPTTTAATQTTPTVSEIESKAAQRTALVADKGDPVTVKTDPNDPNVTLYTYSDGTTAKRTGGRNAQIIPDVPVSVAPVSTAAQEALDLANSKKTAADAMQVEVDKLRAQKDADFAALQAAEASGDKAAIAAADAKYTASSNAAIQTAKAQIELATEARAATNEFDYQQTVKTNQEAANANGGGTVAPMSVNTNSETIAQPAATTGEINTNPPLNNENDPYIATQQTAATNVPTGAFTGNAIKDSEATTISYENGIVTKTQEFGVTAAPVDPANDPTAPLVSRDDEGNLLPGWTEDELGDQYVGFDPAAPDPTLDPLTTPDGVIEGEGDAGTGLEEPPLDPDDDPAVRAMMEASRQEAEDNFEFSDPPIIDPSSDPVYRGPSRDEEGNLMPGWEEGEFGDQYVGPDYVAASTKASADQSRADAAAAEAKLKASLPDPPKDWRVRISLAKSAKYFYNADNPGILKPLKETAGVIFPYTPTVSVAYSARYDTQSPTHSNYNIHNYQGSSVDQVTISGDFTAQDVNDANYMLAVIHFFRSATKMFYGQDTLPARGTPPPLLYLSGYGAYQFDNHPMVLTNFAYSLPTDVDYVNAYPNGTTNSLTGVPLDPLLPAKLPTPSKGLFATAMDRLLGAGLPPGAKTQTGQVFMNKPSANSEVTRVPTKINISLTLQPIITRNAISNKFSLEKYANGSLLRGSRNPGTGGGIW